jgi:cytidylate kinase
MALSKDNLEMQRFYEIYAGRNSDLQCYIDSLDTQLTQTEQEIKYMEMAIEMNSKKTVESKFKGLDR